jgi:hypothetical protein
MLFFRFRFGVVAVSIPDEFSKLGSAQEHCFSFARLPIHTLTTL